MGGLERGRREFYLKNFFFKYKGRKMFKMLVESSEPVKGVTYGTQNTARTQGLLLRNKKGL